MSYLTDDLMCFKCELGGIEELETAIEFNNQQDDDFGGLRELSNIEIKFVKSYLKKRIAWFEAEIEKETEKESKHD
tara:strand:+ start:223 stop:450 length:228 start_codon:yes stop_codon:yes gene_type:complete